MMLLERTTQNFCTMDVKYHCCPKRVLLVRTNNYFTQYCAYLRILIFVTEKIAFIFNDCQKEMQEQEQGGPQGVYEMKKELGTGTFASVRLAVHRTTGLLTN